MKTSQGRRDELARDQGPAFPRSPARQELDLPEEQKGGGRETLLDGGALVGCAGHLEVPLDVGCSVWE